MNDNKTKREILRWTFMGFKAIIWSLQDNHSAKPLSHSLGIKPGLIRRPIQNTHTFTVMPNNTYITHFGPIFFTWPASYMCISFLFSFFLMPFSLWATRTNNTPTFPACAPSFLSFPCAHSNRHLSSWSSVHAVHFGASGTLRHVWSGFKRKEEQ